MLAKISAFVKTSVLAKISELVKIHSISRIDIFLAAAALILAVFAFANLSPKTFNIPRRTAVLVSRQYESLFGADITEKLFKEFEENYPELHVKTMDSGPVDIVFFDEGQLNGMIREEALLSLAPYLHTETENGQWAVPIVSFMDLFFYNIDILKAANVARPPKTRLEVLLCGRAVKNRDKTIAGMAFGLDPDDPTALRRELYSWVWAAGDDFPPVMEGSRMGGNQYELPKTAAAIISFFSQMKAEGLLVPGTFEKTGTQRLNEFAQGKIAMLTASARELPMLEKRMGSSLGITSIPAAALAGKNRIGLSAIHAGISAESTRPAEAWLLLAFLASKSPSFAAALKAVPGSLPSSFSGIGVIPAAYITEDPLLSKAWEIFEASDTVEGFTKNLPGPEQEQFLQEKLIAALGE